MKDFYCNQAKARQGQTITSFFVVSNRRLSTAKSGKEFLSFTLTDRTGQLDAKLWDLTDAAKLIGLHDFVKVQTEVTEYRDRPQLTLKKIRIATQDEIEPADFMAATTADVEELWRKLREFVDSVHEEHIKPLLLAFMDDQEIVHRYKQAPAAKMMHHGRLGGLLEHVVSLCGLIDHVQQHYPWLNRDLLIAGAFLHDIGKIHELEYERCIDYTDPGKLLGHIAIGLKMLDQKSRCTPEFPANLKLLLEHLLLSHHGQLGFGSPVEPATAEALMFHLLDNADSKMEAIRQALEERQPGQIWTEWVKSLGRSVLCIDQFFP